MYVQMLDIYIEKIENIRYFQKYHDIFQPCYLVLCSFSALTLLVGSFDP